MKRIFYILLATLCISISVVAQENLKFETSYSADSTARANRVEVVFVTPYEGFTIEPTNKKDMVMKSREQNGGTFATVVMCDISDAAADRNHTFRVNISGTTIGDYVKVPLAAGKHFTVRVEQALEHNLYLNYPNSQRGYLNATKSAIEFNIPDYVKQPRLEFTEGIGRLLPDSTLQGQTIITLEIDCNALKALQTDIPQKKAKADARLQQLKNELTELEKIFDENSGKEGFDFDKDERQKAKLESEIEHVYDDVPELFVRLSANKANTVRVIPSRLAALAQPRNRLQINVVDGLHKETIYKKAAFDELLSNAREYYNNYRQHYDYKYFDAAFVAYDQAIGNDDCPLNLRDQLRMEKDTIAFLRKYTLYREKADTLARKAEAEKGFASEETYKALVGEHRFLDMLINAHPDMSRFKEIDATIQARIQQHPSAKKTVIEKVTKQRQRVKGRIILDNEYLTTKLNTISIYASPYHTIKKDERARLKLLGKADTEGNFNVVMPEDMDYIITSAEMQRKTEAHLVTTDFIEIHIK